MHVHKFCHLEALNCRRYECVYSYDLHRKPIQLDVPSLHVQWSSSNGLSLRCVKQYTFTRNLNVTHRLLFNLMIFMLFAFGVCIIIHFPAEWARSGILQYVLSMPVSSFHLSFTPESGQLNMSSSLGAVMRSTRTILHVAANIWHHPEL